MALRLECLQSQTVTAMVGEFIWNRAVSPLIYALTWNGMLAINPATTLPTSSGNGIGSSSSTASAKCSDVNVNWTLFGG